MRGVFRLVALGFVLCTAPAAASAQWIVVTSGTASDPRLSNAGARAAAGVTAAGGEVRETSANTGAELMGSLPFTPVTDDEMRELTRASEEALEHVALGRDDRALRIVDEALARFEPRLAAIGRTSQGAQHVQDLCLYGVRAEMHRRRTDESRARAETCLRLVPDLVPNPNLHPPTVRRVITEARELLETNRAGTLIVRASQDDPSECPIRVNGRRMGQTPLLRLPMFAGALSIQVECDPQQPGKVHRATVAAQGESTLTVPVLLESSLGREGALLVLRYANAAQQNERQLRHAAALARTSPGHDVLLVWMPSADVVRMDRFARNQNGDAPIASARVRAENADAITNAARALASGEAPPPNVAAASTSGTAEAQAFVVDDLRPAEDDGGAEPGVGGWALAGIGVAGIATAWALFVDWTRIQDRVDASMDGDPITQFIDQRDDRALHVLVAGGIGAFALTLAIPFWLPKEDGVPAWAWVSGVAGLGLATTGAILWAQHDDRDGLEGEKMRIPLAPLLVMHAAPLLGIPITYALRGAMSDDGVSASVEVDDRAFVLRVRSAF